MKRRFFTLMLVVAMLAMTLVGCSETTDTTDTTNNDTNVETDVEVDAPTDDTLVEDTADVPVVDDAKDEANSNDDVVNGEDDKPVYEYAYTWTFPEGMDGFTNKYLNEEYPDWSVNYTHYVDSNGNEMNFRWEGPIELGENAFVATGYPTLLLVDSTGNYNLQAWTYGEVNEEKFETDLGFTQETWTSFADSYTPYVENGYYDIQTTDTTIEVIFEVANDMEQGYNYYVVDLNHGTCYQFAYLENIEVYNDTRAMNVIKSLDFWDYTPE